MTPERPPRTHYQCDGCGRRYRDERRMVRCFERHICNWCGGPMRIEHAVLTPAARMLWCGCHE